MRSPWARTSIRVCHSAAAGLAIGWLTLAAPLVPAQAQSLPSETAAPTQSAPVKKPGLFEAIGRWLDEGATKIRNHLRSAKERSDKLSDQAAAERKKIDKSIEEAAKAAAESIPKIPPVAHPIDGHERCALAPNGAPDCLAAAERLCRQNGFASGKSLEFTSAEECPAHVVLAGRRSGAECTTVTFITRALCQ